MAKGVLKVAESQWGGKEAGRIGSSRVSVSVCVSFLVLGRQIKAPKDSLTHESCAAPGESQNPDDIIGWGQNPSGRLCVHSPNCSS